jgi:hypothetical protein
MSGYSGIIDEDALNATQAAYDPLFRMHRPSGAPPPMERESETAYRRSWRKLFNSTRPTAKTSIYAILLDRLLMSLKDKLSLTRRGRRSIRLRYQKAL